MLVSTLYRDFNRSSVAVSDAVLSESDLVAQATLSPESEGILAIHEMDANDDAPIRRVMGDSAVEFVGETDEEVVEEVREFVRYSLLPGDLRD